jgi:tetratricopeptide (TPR) repeat protein
LDAGFVFGDNTQIVNNPFVVELRHFWRAITSPVWAFKHTSPTNYFRPVQMGSYNLLWALGGNPLPFHVTNVLLHVANTGLLVLVVRRISTRGLLAFGAGLLFAVHPLTTETVAWIACLPELAYTFGLLGALASHLGGWSSNEQGRHWRTAGKLGLFALALFSKETAVVLVGLVWLAEFWIRPGGGEWRSRGWAAFRATGPFLITLVAYLAVRTSVVGGFAPVRRFSMTLWEAGLNVPMLVGSYLRSMIAPVNLLAHHMFEPVRGLTDPRLLLGSAVVVALLVVLWLARRRHDVLFAAALLLAPLAPVLYVPALSSPNPFAERYAYLSTAGMAWLIAAGVEALARRTTGDRAPRVAVIVLVVLALAGTTGTVRRNRVWADDGALARTTLSREPGAHSHWFLLANWHKQNEDLEAALETYERALEQFPGETWLQAERAYARLELHRASPEETARELQRIDAQENQYWIKVYLGNALRRSGDTEGARRAFEGAIATNPSYRPAFLGLRLVGIDAGDSMGLAQSPWLTDDRERLVVAAELVRAGRLDEAQARVEDVLRGDPDSHEALLAMALIAAQRSDHLSSLDYCRRAIERSPDYVDAHQQLGLSALRLGRPDKAIEALERAAAIDPYHKQVQNRLGVAYVRAGREDDARRAWSRALEIDPDFEPARHNLNRLTEGTFP